MATTIPSLTPYPDEAPQRGTRDTFRELADSKVAHDYILVNQVNSMISAIHNVVAEMTLLQTTEATVGDALSHIANPTSDVLCSIPFKNSLAITQGVGAVTFNRASAATAWNRYGILVDLASGEAGYDVSGIDLPPASTNKLLYNSDFTNAAWLDPDSEWSVTSSGNPGVRGTNTADYITIPGTTATIRQSVIIADGSSLSVFAKVLSGTITGFLMDHGDGASVDVTNQLVTGAWARLESPGMTLGVGGDRIDFEITCTAGTVVALEEAQFEALPFCTPPIHTEASPVARLGATCTFPYSENFPGSLKDKTVIFDVDVIGTNRTSAPAFDSGDLQMNLSHTEANDDKTWVWMNVNNVTDQIAITEPFRFGMTYNTASTTLRMYHNGILISENASISSVYSAFSDIILGSDDAYIKIKNLVILDKCLTEQQMRIA